jgi:hypothetical protein
VIGHDLGLAKSDINRRSGQPLADLSIGASFFEGVNILCYPSRYYSLLSLSVLIISSHYSLIKR